MQKSFGTFLQEKRRYAVRAIYALLGSTRTLNPWFHLQVYMFRRYRLLWCPPSISSRPRSPLNHSFPSSQTHSFTTMHLGRAVTTTASLAHMGSVLAQTMGPPQVDEICPIGLNIQPIEFQVLQPILVDTFVPANTDLVINDDLVLHVTDAPVSLRTVLTETSTSVTQLTRFVQVGLSRRWIL